MAIANAKKQCMEIEIPEISKLEKIWSPEILIHGVPWQVRVCKMGQTGQESLTIHLFSGNKDESPDWSLWGMASFKLLPVNDDDNSNAIEHHTDPYIFDNSGRGFGTDSLVKWNDLFNLDKKYVKDDTINLEIKIAAENPNDPNRSRLHFECVEKCCNNSGYAKLQLKVTNVQNLMAVKSPNFTLCGLPWNVQISKTRSSHLGAMLQLNKDPEKKLKKVSISIKLVPSKGNVQPIEKCITKEFRYLEMVSTAEIVPLNEMIKPENGFVADDAITLHIKIKPDDSDEPSTEGAKFKPSNELKFLQMECPICLQCITDQELAVIPCGHMFCLVCIKKAIANRTFCPNCNKVVRSNTLRPLYLPIVN